MVELPPTLASWLKRHGLRVDVRAMKRHPESRNPTLLCRDRGGQRVFVKSAVRDDPGIAHEQVVLRALQSLASVPKMRHAAGGTLALEWLEGRTLWELRRATKPCPDEAIGAALARVQLEGRGAVSSFGVRGDLGERLLWTSPAFFASLGPASLQLVKQVQASGPALQSLRELLEGETADRALLVHGDLRQANVMVHRGRITFVDWELCGLGDPARDLGMLLADDVRAWLLPRDEEEVQSRAELERHARALMTGWENAAAQLGFTPADDHRSRVMRWTAEALLRAAYTMTHHHAHLPQPLVDAGIAMLEAPADWSLELLGLRRPGGGRFGRAAPHPSPLPAPQGEGDR
ncbi:MAG: phosphotransferase [Archangium sp.]|nr:phosphotransferase [Archangium sp.]